MRTINSFLLVSIQSIIISSHLNAHEPFDLELYNNLVSQHLLTACTNRHRAEPYVKAESAHASTSCKVTSMDDIAWSKEMYMKRRGTTITIYQGSSERSFCVNHCEITRAWFYNCQKIGIIGKDQNGNLVMQDYRVCHKADLEYLDMNQRALFVRAKAALLNGHTPVIEHQGDYQTYCTLPTDLQKVFQVSAALLPKPLPKLSTTCTALINILLGGYIAIF